MSSPASTGIVIAGNARFEVLSATLIRLEYSADGRFEDRPTFNAVNRRPVSVDQISTSTENGTLVISTGRVTLRYRLDSGPFTPANLRVDLRAGAQPVTARPSWELAGSCDHRVGCEAELLELRGGAAFTDGEPGHTGRGFVAGLARNGARIGWTQRAIPRPGSYSLQVRYASSAPAGVQQQLVLKAAGQTTTLSLDPTAGAWATFRTPVDLPGGDSPFSLECPEHERCQLAVDSVAVTPPGADYPAPVDPEHTAANLGGWRRSLDEASGPRPLYEGMLSRDGWYLLNDTETALLNADFSLTQRPARIGNSYQDGYFFGYGHDYRRGLRDLAELTGPSMMLPRWAFGNWFSRYFAYSDADYRNEILPAFRANRVPLDVLVVDTDFKAPNKWNGWAWDPQYFPDPRGFVDWAHGQGLQVALNIHPSIADSDPRYAEVRTELGYDLDFGDCGLPERCRVFDLTNPAQLRAYFGLHRPFEQQGIDLWWADTCCDGSRARAPGISPDSWINAQYALRADQQGRRGFSWDRSGSGYTGYAENAIFPAGPWADHRYTVDTSMDTVATWEMLAFESYYTIRRGNIGMAYESHDIGAHNYAGNPENRLPEDLYARWVQFGTFQPVLRLHSNHGYRVPWDYPGPGGAAAAKFMQLREALVPYVYTVARQAHESGLPMARGMYLNYPEQPDAYRFDKQYLFGDDLLVAPVTTPGVSQVPTEVWFPPGSWVDYFTGQRYTGPGVHTVRTDLATMPVFLRAGAILPTRTDYVDYGAQRPLDQVTLDVASGGPGSFTLYEDEGEGHGHRDGKSGRTALWYKEKPEQRSATLVIAGRAGQFPGAVPERTWTVRIRDVDAPTTVTLNGTALPPTSWSYDQRTLTIRTPALSTAASATLSFRS